MPASLSLQISTSSVDVLGMHVSLHQLGTNFGYLGSALGVAMVIPQILRTLAHRHMTGVSILSWTLTVFACSDWLLYGIRDHETVQIPGNALLVTGAIVVVLIVPARLAVGVRAAGLAGGIAVLCLLATLLQPDIIGSIAIAIGVTSTLPQVVRSIQRPVDVPSAVSISTWYMRVASQACWVVFALLVHDHVVLASACFTETCNLVVLITELRRASTVEHIGENTADVAAPPLEVCATTVAVPDAL